MMETLAGATNWARGVLVAVTTIPFKVKTGMLSDNAAGLIIPSPDKVSRDTLGSLPGAFGPLRESPWEAAKIRLSIKAVSIYSP